ncbi:hypothetical protein SNARM312S_00872 [Streptomyces narbonensis]
MLALPPAASSHTTNSPLRGSGPYRGGSRSILSAGTWKAVSFIPSGSRMRSRRNASSDMPATRDTSTPTTSLLRSYCHRTPGWYCSGSSPRRRIHSSGSGAGPEATL